MTSIGAKHWQHLSANIHSTDSSVKLSRASPAVAPVNTKPEPSLSVSQYLSKYSLWLEEHCPAKNTRRVYLSRVKHFLRFVCRLPCHTSGAVGNNTIQNEGDMSVFNTVHIDFKDPLFWKSVITDYMFSVKTDLKPASINAVLTALENFSRFHELRNAVRAEYFCPDELHVLKEEEQQRFLAATEQWESTKYKAIVLLFFFTGIKIGQCASLNSNDVELSSVPAKVILRRNRAVELILPQPATKALALWLKERKALEGASMEPALFINNLGKRMSTSGLDMIIRKTGVKANLYVTPRMLRHTFLQKSAKTPLLEPKASEMSDYST